MDEILKQPATYARKEAVPIIYKTLAQIFPKDRKLLDRTYREIHGNMAKLEDITDEELSRLIRESVYFCPPDVAETSGIGQEALSPQELEERLGDVQPIPVVEKKAPAVALPAALANQGRRNNLSLADYITPGQPIPFPGQSALHITYSLSENLAHIVGDIPDSDYIEIQLYKEFRNDYDKDKFGRGGRWTGPLSWLAGYPLRIRRYRSTSSDSLDFRLRFETKAEEKAEKDTKAMKHNPAEIAAASEQPRESNFYIMPLGDFERGYTLGVRCDTGRLRGIIYTKKKPSAPKTGWEKIGRFLSSAFPSYPSYANIGFDWGIIIRLFGEQDTITGWITRAGLNGTNGVAIVEAPDKSQISLIPPKEDTTINGTITSVNDVWSRKTGKRRKNQLEIKVKGIYSEYGLGIAGALVGAAGLGALSYFFPDVKPLLGVLGGAAGLFGGLTYAEQAGKSKLGYSVLGTAIGAGANLLAAYIGYAPASALAGGIDGLLLGNIGGRLLASQVDNPLNGEPDEQALAALHLTEVKLHNVMMTNHSGIQVLYVSK
jgi:hypothetical protein